jgi:hypothetical protein
MGNPRKLNGVPKVGELAVRGAQVDPAEEGERERPGGFCNNAEDDGVLTIPWPVVGVGQTVRGR